MSVRGNQRTLWTALDEAGKPSDIPVQKRRNPETAGRFLLRLQGDPIVVTKRRRCLKMRGLRPRAPQACSKHAEDDRLERNAADSSRYGVS